MWTCFICGTENDDASELCMMCGGYRPVDGAQAASQSDRQDFAPQPQSIPQSQAQVLSQPQPQPQQYRPQASEPVWDRPPSVSYQGPAPSPVLTGFGEPQRAGTPMPPSPSAGRVPVSCASAAAHVMQPSNSSASTKLSLEMLTTGAVIEVGPRGGTVGREGDFGSDALANCSRVSRNHVLLNPQDNGWSVRHCGSNPSFLFTSDGSIDLAPGFDAPIHDGETLRMADVSFRIHIQPMGASEEPACVSQVPTEDNAPAIDSSLQTVQGGLYPEASSGVEFNLGSSPSPAATVEQDSADSELVEGWFIDCPPGGCGHSFLVSNENSRLALCPYCVDRMDKMRIARIAPVRGWRHKGEFDDARG